MCTDNPTMPSEPSDDITRHLSLAMTWSDVLPVLLALLRDGNGEEQRCAERELRRMAAAADLGNEAIAAIGGTLEQASPQFDRLAQLLWKASVLQGSGTMPVGDGQSSPTGGRADPSSGSSVVQPRPQGAANE